MKSNKNINNYLDHGNKCSFHKNAVGDKLNLSNQGQFGESKTIKIRDTTQNPIHSQAENSVSDMSNLLDLNAKQNASVMFEKNKLDEKNILKKSASCKVNDKTLLIQANLFVIIDNRSRNMPRNNRKNTYNNSSRFK